MDEAVTLSAQLETLTQELGRLQQAPDSESIDANRRQRVHVRFDTLISKQQRALQDPRNRFQPGELLSSLAKAQDDPVRLQPALQRVLGPPPGRHDAQRWLGHRHLPDHGWPDGGSAGQNRDRLAASRHPRRGSLFARVTEIITVLFPQFSVWNLPPTGHEFSHLVGQELRALERDAYSYLFQELTGRGGRGGHTPRASAKRSGPELRSRGHYG
jgi:hypothetical protein